MCHLICTAYLLRVEGNLEPIPVGVLGENPQRCRENMQPLHSKGPVSQQVQTLNLLAVTQQC